MLDVIKALTALVLSVWVYTEVKDETIPAIMVGIGGTFSCAALAIAIERIRK